MILYILEYYNGLDFADSENVLLGIYPSREERCLAEKRYSTYDQWPFTKEGKFIRFEVELAKDIFPEIILPLPLALRPESCEITEEDAQKLFDKAQEIKDNREKGIEPKKHKRVPNGK